MAIGLPGDAGGEGSARLDLLNNESEIRKEEVSMDLMELEERIMKRMWRCNELSEKQAAHYAWLAVNELQKCVKEARDRLPEVRAVNDVLHERNKNHA